MHQTAGITSFTIYKSTSTNTYLAHHVLRLATVHAADMLLKYILPVAFTM